MGNPQQHAPAQKCQQAQQRHSYSQRRSKGQHTTGGDPDQPVDDCPFAAQAVRRPSGKGPAEQGGQVLQADGDTGDDRTETQLIMHIAGQYRDRQADAEEGDEGVEDNREDLPGDRPGVDGSGLLRGHELVRWRAVGEGP
ncbi:hypothetical protein D3C79_867330 [compost metagenome]